MEREWVAYQAIREKILSLKHKPGFQLKEVPLAQEYSLTRTLIRKAIARLVNEGLVETFRHKGAFVTALSRSEINDIFEVREALEVRAVHLAIRRSCRDELDRIQHGLEEDIQSMRRNRSEEWHLPKMDFHHEIIKLSRNNTLVTIWEGLQTKLHRPRLQSSMVDDRYPKALEEHKEILACIYQNRPADAERLLILHLHNAKPNLSAFLT